MSAVRPSGARGGWLRWAARGLGLLVMLVAAAGVIVIMPARLAGWTESGGEAIGTGYLYSLVALPISWPLYMTVLALVARRARHPRRWAIALSPLLGAWFALLIFVVIDLPDFYAAWLLWLSYGALVPLPPEATRRAGAGAGAPS